MIVSLYLGILGIFYAVLTVKVVRARIANQISLGVGEKKEIIGIVSAHENFSNYAPIFLIGLYLLEIQSANIYLLHLLGIAFVIGRILHFVALQSSTLPKRKAGMMLTLFPLVILSAVNLFFFLRQL